MGFKENLKDELAYQGLLVKELASKAGLNPSSLSNYLRENSSIPAADIAVKIAGALNVSVEYLVTGRDSASSASCDSCSANIRRLSIKLTKLSPRDLSLVAALVDSMLTDKN